MMHANSVLRSEEVPVMPIFKKNETPRMKMISVAGNSGGIAMLEAWYDFIENLFYYEVNNEGRIDGSDSRIEGKVKMYFFKRKQKSSDVVQSYIKNFLQMRISPYESPRRQLIELTEPFGRLPDEVLNGFIDTISIFIGHHSVEFSYEFTHEGKSYNSPRLIVMQSLFSHTVVLPIPGAYIDQKE